MLFCCVFVRPTQACLGGRSVWTTVLCDVTAGEVSSSTLLVLQCYPFNTNKFRIKAINNGNRTELDDTKSCYQLIITITICENKLL